MKKILTILMLIVTVGMLNAQKVVRDENTTVRKVSSFHSIAVSHGVDLYLSQSNEEAVAVSASSTSHRDKIVTEVVDGVLKIWYDNGSSWGSNWGNKKLKAYVSAKTLRSLRASGGSDVDIEGVFRTTDLTINISGGSDLDGAINCESLKLNASGGSDANLRGKALKAQVEASGGSDVDAFELLTDYCKVRSSGGSDVNITANKEIDASASGGSDIRYKGTAQATVTTSSKSSGVKKVS